MAQGGLKLLYAYFISK